MISIFPEFSRFQTRQASNRRTHQPRAMSTETTQNNVAATPPPAVDAPSSVEPKQIVNAQTVCNELNEKKKLCNGHLKQLSTGGQGAEKHLRGDDALFKCQTCGTLYMGPPLGHLRDPDKQSRFVERELTALLLAAGGTMPVIVKNDKGAYVLAEVATPHAAAPAAKAAPPSKGAPAGDTPVAENAAAKSVTPAGGAKAEATKGHAIKVGPIPGAEGPVPGETREQKIERLRGVAAEAKRRAEARDAAEAAGEVAPVVVSPATEPAAKVAAPESSETTQDVAPAAETAAASTAPVKAAPIPGADGPVPGETFEQKIERLKGVVAVARERAILEGRREA